MAFTNYVPRPVPSSQVEVARFVRTNGEPYVVLRQRQQQTYLSLTEDGYGLWSLMDGTRTIREIAVEFAMLHGRLVTGLLAGLVQQLREKGFLQDPPVAIFSGLAKRRTQRTLFGRVKLAVETVLSRDLVQWRGGDAALGTWYRAGAWCLFTRAALVCYVLVIVLGLAGWALDSINGRHALFTTNDSYVLGFIGIFVLDMVALALHELGHAMATKHVGREVIGIGVMLYYGELCAYVNTSDVWMTDRWKRMLTAAAGPFVSLLLAALAGIASYLAPDGSLVGDLAFKAATVWLLDVVFNVMPLLELDGYYVLVDLLEMPLLRTRSFAFVRHDLLPKLLRRSPWTRDETALAIYGLGAGGFSLVMLMLSIWFWNVRGVEVASELWNLPAWYGKPLMVLFLLVLGGPLVVGIGGLLLQAGRAAWARLRWHLQEWGLRRRAEPLVAILPQLGMLSETERLALAEHARARRFSPGEAVVRQGDVANGFYVIARGQAVVEQLGAHQREQRVAILGPGDHFGELAYLNQEPRNATVRAHTPLEVYHFDGGHFRRWFEKEVQTHDSAEIRRRMVDWAVLEHLPLLRDVPPSERLDLLDDLDVERFAAGELVFRQGDPGDRLYLIAEGRFGVLRHADDALPWIDGEIVTELGPGAYFGEIALLHDYPRNATVRALTPAICYTLSADGFAQVLDAAPDNRHRVDRLALDRILQPRAGHGAPPARART